MKKKIVFTGGHHNSALEIAKLLQSKGYEIIWLGHKHTMRGDRSLSFEYQEVVKSGIEFIELKTGKFYRPSHFIEWLKIPFGFYSSWKFLRQIKPRLVVAFGAYLSAPVVFAANLLKIPSVCHEQTTKAGIANRFNSIFAKKVFIAWSESYRYFPTNKTIFAGLPLRKTNYSKLKNIHDFKNNLPTILITGGKQGSHAINMVTSKAYLELLGRYNIIHQSGGLKKTNDFHRLHKIKESLPGKLQKRLCIKKYFFQVEMCQAQKQADLVICRAGAHTVYELIHLGKPTLFIPLKKSYTKEQLGNARKAKDLQMAEILLEERLNKESLVLQIDMMFKKLSSFKTAGKKAKKLIKLDATEFISLEIEKLL